MRQKVLQLSLDWQVEQHKPPAGTLWTWSEPVPVRQLYTANAENPCGSCAGTSEPDQSSFVNKGREGNHAAGWIDLFPAARYLVYR